MTSSSSCDPVASSCGLLTERIAAVTGSSLTGGQSSGGERPRWSL